MKKGDIVPITYNAAYSGHETSWLEPMTDRRKIKKGTKLLHASESKITAFYPQETCFFTDDRSVGHIYIATLLKDIIVDFYDEEEVRFEIDNSNIEIKYIGYRGQHKKWNYKYKDFTLKSELKNL